MKKKARGSALIVAFLLIAAVGGTALSIGRLFLMDQSISQLYEDSIVSYYAAESGIEEGLLRYRHDKDVEIPSADDTQVLRTDLSANSSMYTTPTTKIDFPNKIMYDLKIDSYGSFYSNDLDHDSVLDTNEYVPLAKDETIKLDVLKTVEGNLNQISLWVNLAGGSDANSFIEAKLIGKVGSVLKEYKKAFLFALPTTGEMFAPGTYEILTKNGNIYSNTDLKTAIAGSVAFSESAELSLKPVNLSNTSLNFALSVNNLGQIVMPNTVVKSTGHYGRNTRTLTAKIDRQSGTVYDLFDYVVYDRK